jgi:excinuclease ABC subunit C
MVELVRLFLANRRNELSETLRFRIQLASDALDFETAAYWRDILEAVEKYWSNPRWNVWLDGDVVDTFAIDDESSGLRIYLITQRNRYVLGRKVFSFNYPTSLDEAMAKIIHNFYVYYAPKEIRITQDFADRRKLAKKVGDRFRRSISINVITNKTARITTLRAARLTRDEMELDSAKPDASPKSIASELKGLFDLKRAPKRVECFDVAHISAKGFVAAWSTWIDGHFVGSEYGFQISRESSELATLANAVHLRLSESYAPDLVVLDGGRNQLNAVLENLSTSKRNNTKFVAAAKPPGKHSGIAYFLLDSGERIEFDESSPAQNRLKMLRDDAHDLANGVHRDLRDLSHNYELAAVLPSLSEGERRSVLKIAGSISKLMAMPNEQVVALYDPERSKAIIRDLQHYRLSELNTAVPLIVPIRFDDENGGADDMRPLPSK